MRRPSQGASAFQPFSVGRQSSNPGAVQQRRFPLIISQPCQKILPMASAHAPCDYRVFSEDGPDLVVVNDAPQDLVPVEFSHRIDRFHL